MSENRTLRIHTRLSPDRATPQNDPIQPVSAEKRKLSAKKRAASRRARRKLTAGERLLRNSAIACAVLLGILTLGNFDAPWAKKASDGIERALTMHIDLDENIGALQFVRNLMPESALVFMNLGGATENVRPVEGEVLHAWTNLQPWMMFRCADGAAVRSIRDGVVTAISPLSDDRYGVLLDHGEGVETLYAGLKQVDVAQGDAVDGGQAIGLCGDSAYFEYRLSGESIDPAPVLNL